MGGESTGTIESEESMFEKSSDIALVMQRQVLNAMFISDEVSPLLKWEADILARVLGEDCPDWLAMLADGPESKENVEEAAKWFCVWWLENHAPHLLKGQNDD